MQQESEKIFSQRLIAVIGKKKCEGWSQERIADQIGVQRKTLFNWMRGDSTPDVSQLRLLCRFFAVSADWLMGDDAEPVPDIRSRVDQLTQQVDALRMDLGMAGGPASNRPRIEGVNSDQAADVALVARDAAAKVAGLDPESSPSPEAAAPIAHKSAPSRGTAPHSTKRPVPPKPAPAGPGK